MTCSDIDKSQNNYAEWKKNIYCHLYKILEKANYSLVTESTSDAWAWANSKDGTDYKGCLDTFKFYVSNLNIFIFVQNCTKILNCVF